MRAASAKCRVPRSYAAHTSPTRGSAIVTSSLVRVATPRSLPGAAPEATSVVNAAITESSASGRNCATERRPSSTSNPKRSTAPANCRATARSSSDVGDFAACEACNTRSRATVPERRRGAIGMTRLRHGSGRECDSSAGSKAGAGSRNPPWNTIGFPSIGRSPPGDPLGESLTGVQRPQNPCADLALPRRRVRRAGYFNSARRPSKSVGMYSSGLVVQSCPDCGS